jgi:hypothetical protein
MLRTTDRVFGVLLVLGSCGHTAGTLLWIPAMSGMWIWSLGSSLAAALLGTLNIVRAGRPEDRTLAVITTLGTAVWALLALAFGISIGNLLDPRALMHFVVSVVLVSFGLVTLRTTLKVGARRGSVLAP